MSDDKRCCPTNVEPIPPTAYPKKGRHVTVDQTDLYISGNGPKAIIVITDVFGWGHDNAFALTDLLAEGGFTAVCPDWFHGNPRTGASSKDPETINQWRANYTWEKTVASDIAAATKLLQQEGSGVAVGALGLCWGGKIVFRAAAEGAIRAGVAVHPSRLEATDGAACPVPMCVLLSKDEQPLEDLKEELEKKPFAAQNVWQRFDDMHHGWIGARGVLPATLSSTTDEAKRALEAITIALDFFKRVL